MVDQNTSRGCLKTGCIGCGGLGVLGLAAVLVLTFSSMSFRMGPAQLEKVERQHAVPVGGEDAVTNAPAAESPDAAGEDRGVGHADGQVPSEIAELPAGSPRAGRVELDLRGGRFMVRPGASDEPIRLEGDYDQRTGRLSEELVDDGTGGWIYRVRFVPRGGIFGMLRANGDRNRFTLTIPRGVPVDLEGTVEMGQSEIELGGLDLRTVDLELKMGQHQVEISEPTPEPAERLAFHGAMGQLQLGSLGNASPAQIEISHRMGDAQIDLRGEWRGDGDIETSFRFGQCRIRVPEDVHLDVSDTQIEMGDRAISIGDRELDAAAPTLVIHADGRGGELDIY